MAPRLPTVESFDRAWGIYIGVKNAYSRSAKDYFQNYPLKANSSVLEALYMIVKQQQPDEDPIDVMAQKFNVESAGIKWKPHPDQGLIDFELNTLKAWIEQKQSASKQPATKTSKSEKAAKTATKTSKTAKQPEPEESEEEKEYDDEDEGDVDDDGDDDDYAPEDAAPFKQIDDYKGQGTGRFTNILDSVVDNQLIFPSMTFNDLPEDKIELPKPKPTPDDSQHNLDPNNYKLVKLDSPFTRNRSPYSAAELGMEIPDDVWSKFGYITKFDEPRETRLPTIYYWLDRDITKRKADAHKLTHMYVHATIGLPHTWKTNKRWSVDLLTFLLALSDFSQAQVNELWGMENNERKKPTRTFKNHEVMASKYLHLYYTEATAYGPDRSYTGSVTLMYSLLKYAHVNKIACRETKPRNALDILIMRELVIKFKEIKKALNDPKKAIDHKSIKDAIHYIQNIGFVASLIYEVLAGTSVQLTGWNQLISLLLKDIGTDRKSQLRQRYGNPEGDPDDVGRASIGLYLIVSRDKKQQRAQIQNDKELKGNQKPVVFNTTKMKGFSNKLVNLIIDGGSDAWKAAAICVEMHTGARITEVLGYAEFESFSDMRERDPDRARVLLESIRQKTQSSYHLNGIENSIIQQGVLKRKGNRNKSGKRSDASFFDETLPPKPVIMDLTAFDIKKALFKVRQHVYNYMYAKKKIDKDQRLRNLPPTFFRPLTTQINAYLRQIFPDGAIVGHQAHTEGKRKNKDKTVSTHVLRRFYANYSFDHHALGMVRNVWIMTVLGHDAKGLATSLSYTNATMEDPLQHIAIPQKESSMATMTLNVLQDIRDDFSNQFREIITDHLARPSHPSVRPHSVVRKRKRNELDDDDDKTLVAVIKGPPVFVRRVMPARDTESRTTTDREKADIVKKYVEENFLFQHEGHTYICKPTQAALISKCHFGHTYANAFVKLEKDMVDKMAREYDDILSP